MDTKFPLLPGYTPTHDPTAVDWKKTSHVKLEKNSNPTLKTTPIDAIPIPISKEFNPEKTSDSKSFSQSIYQNPFGTGDITEKFTPSYQKLDKQVLQFRGYFQESVVERAAENHRIRSVKVYFYLEDSSIMISELKQTNSGTPQGTFLKRQIVNKPGCTPGPVSYTHLTLPTICSV